MDVPSARRQCNFCHALSRHSRPFYVQHLWTAHASGAELESQIEVGRRIQVVTASDADALIADAQEIGRMINGLVGALERRR